MTKIWSLYLVVAMLALLLVCSQYRLWFADGGIRDNQRMEQRVGEHRAKNTVLADRNGELAQYIQRLKKDDSEYEALARERFGMVKEDELFFLFVDGGDASQDTTYSRTK